MGLAGGGGGGGGPGGAAGVERKTRTPHSDVGKNLRVQVKHHEKSTTPSSSNHKFQSSPSSNALQVSKCKISSHGNEAKIDERTSADLLQQPEDLYDWRVAKTFTITAGTGR